jgi:hypothetical protein
MNRTNSIVGCGSCPRPVRVAAVVLVAFVAAVARAQESPPSAPPTQTPVAPADPVATAVAAMRAGERAARSVRLEVATEAALPGDLSLRTSGSLRVLRGAQTAASGSATPAALHTRMSVEFADGLHGSMESVQRADGIWILEDSPAFGEVHLHIEPRLVADLVWAGEVLDRTDLPGIADRRADAPLGSTMLAGLARQFVLAPSERRERAGDAGQWFVGPRRAAPDVEEVDLPLADRVEVFVRDRDHALLEVVQWLGERRVQHIVVSKVEIDVDLDPESFRLDARGVKVREAQQYLPMWEQIEQILKAAERRAPEGVVRPSRR